LGGKAGDIIMLDFDPQAGREQAKRRPALVITDRRYKSGQRTCRDLPLDQQV
jgi:mRNA interferase MazF